MKRQDQACQDIAETRSLDLVEVLSEIVSGSDPLYERRVFLKLLKYAYEKGIRYVLVENSRAVARDADTLWTAPASATVVAAAAAVAVVVAAAVATAAAIVAAAPYAITKPQV